MAITFTPAERTCLLAFYRMAQTVDSETRNREALFLRDRAAIVKNALGKLTSQAAVQDLPPPQPAPQLQAPSMVKRAQDAVSAARVAAARAVAVAEHSAERTNGLVESTATAEGVTDSSDVSYNASGSGEEESNDDEPVAILDDEKA